MNRKASALSFALLLLFSVVAGALLVNLATANFILYLPYIVINSDGTVTPETEFINQTGNVYTLTGNLTEKYAIKIQCSNIVFDGAEYIINGTADNYRGVYNTGISLENVSNVIVKDVRVYQFTDVPLLLQGCVNCSVFRIETDYLLVTNSSFNTISESSIRSLVINYSDNNVIARNSIQFVGLTEGNLNTFIENNFFMSTIAKYWIGGYRGNSWDNGFVGNYWSAYNGTDANGDGIGDTPYVISSEAQDRYPLMNPWDPVIPYDTVPPRISILSPESKVYNQSDVPLTFLTYEATSSMSYSLNGQDNVTITGNTTLSELPNGSHNVTVYATDLAGNNGASETIHFNVNVPEPFPTALAVGTLGASAAGAALCILYYYKKRNR